MLEHEYVLLLERLQASRGDKTSFFVFADTVATRTRTSDGHGWMGVRYQINPQSPPHDVIIHLRVWDTETLAQQQAIGIPNIQKTVADYYGLQMKDLLGKKRTRSLARPRQVAMAMTKELTEHSLPEIGDAFGGRDHTTVLHACRQIRTLMETDGKLREDWDKLIRKLSE